MLKKLYLVGLISSISFTGFAQTPMVHYQYKTSEIKLSLGPSWKLADRKNEGAINVTGYIPTNEKRKFYSKMIAVGKIKKVAEQAAQQIALFDSHKKAYLVKHQCKITNLSHSKFSNFKAKSVTAFDYQCKKLNISGIDITLNADDPASIYNIIYEYRTNELTAPQKTKAMKILGHMEICYDNNPKCASQA